MAFVQSCPKSIYKLNPKTNLIEIADFTDDDCIFCQESVKKLETFGLDSERLV